MGDRFYFTNSDDSTSNLSDHDPDNDSSLPFPKPINRSSFHSPDFDPATFLSSLSNRFQTLEDLQDELRELSQSLNKELIDLVNDNYRDFLSLGSTLAGGEEKVEEIRVGLLGFQRDVAGVRDKVAARRTECETLLTEKKMLRREIARGRVLLEIAERIDDLEDGLKISRTKPVALKNTEYDVDLDQTPNQDQTQWDDDWDEPIPDESDDEIDEELGISGRSKTMVEKYQIIRTLMRKHDQQHPFLVSQRERIAKIQETIRMDLEAAIRSEGDVKVKQKIIQLRASLDST